MSSYGLNSEYDRLTGVLIYPPGPEIGDHPDPASIQQLRPIDHYLMGREYGAIQETFDRLGIRVRIITPEPPDAAISKLHNMMFCRDLFFMTPFGAIMASMANETRRPEVQFADRTFKRLGIPVIHRIHGAGRFEGADALWLNEKSVIVGVGNRTNHAAFIQIKEVMEQQGVPCVPLPSNQTRTQHLLGSLQIVDRDLALVRREIIDPVVNRFLLQHGFATINLPESEELRERQAMNILVIAPRTIIMTAGCPETRMVYEQAGLTIAAELELSQLINGAGGLACATGIIARSRSHEKYELT